MIIAVGSKNRAKLKAVEKAFARYYKNFEVIGIEVNSGVGKQPVSLEGIVKGAENRARQAWKKTKCDFSVGIEAGIFKVPGTKTGYMDTGAAAIFDGKQIHLGLTPCFEYPKIVIEKVLNEGKEVSEAFREKCKDYEKDEMGVIGRLTKGAVPRHLFNEMALLMALAPIVNKEYYK